MSGEAHGRVTTMSLPAPNLDNRRFQDLVDEAKRLIPRFCPEWTDHNVSDPGIALVELFAWMTESLLYRVNQVPEKNYIKFLEMLGVRLEPPRAARAPVTFYLSGPQSGEITIPQGTEAATIRTETAPAIVFTTEADLTIRPPRCGACSRTARASATTGWVKHELSRLALPGQSVILFPNPPVTGRRVPHRARQGPQPSRAGPRRRLRKAPAARASIPSNPPVVVGGVARRHGAMGSRARSSTTARAASTGRRDRPAPAGDGSRRLRGRRGALAAVPAARSARPPVRGVAGAGAVLPARVPRRHRERASRDRRDG